MAKKGKSKEKSKGGGGLSVKTFGGLNAKRYTKGTGVPRVKFNKGETVTVQFEADIDDETGWIEINQHQFQDDGWKYVPCLGDDCPLCEDESNDVRKVHYRFFTNVYNFGTKQIEVLEGPKDLSGRIAGKAKRMAKKPGKFLKTVFDVSKLDQSPVTYEVDIEDDHKPVKIDEKKLIDLHAHVLDQAKRYFGDDMPTEGSSSSSKKSKNKKSSLDDDDYEEDEEYDEDDLEEMSDKEVKSIAKGMKIALKNPKTDKPRSKEKLIQLILKKQDS
jgi:hypothetical protein